MGITDFVFRRGASYVWRRRLPRSLGGALLQVSLRTNEPLIARRIAAKVTVASNNLFERMTTTNLTRENARKLLEQVIREEIDRIQRRKIVESDETGENAWEVNQSHDRMAAKAYRLLAERGRSAALTAAEHEAMTSGSGAETDLARLDRYLDLFRQDYWSDTRMRRIAALLRDRLEIPSPSAVDLVQGRQILLRGRAAAHQLMVDRAGADMDEADALAAEILDEHFSERFSRPGHAQPVADAFPAPANPAPIAPEAGMQPSASAAAPLAVPPMFDPDFVTVAERLLASRGENIGDDTAKQMLGVVRLFTEASGITDIREFRQGHLARFVEMLRVLPKTYRKSPKDRNKSLAEILQDGRKLPANKKGMSESTINRNLGYLQQFFRQGRSEGLEVSQTIDIGLLRVKETMRDRDKRIPYTESEVLTIFQNPVWHGSKSAKRQRFPGTVLCKNSLFWVPLICALSGARREEIAGLRVSEVAEFDGIWCYNLDDNVNRTLKTPSSKRLVPIHSHVLELGFLEYRAGLIKKGKHDLFHDLKPENDVESFGDGLDYMWRQIVKQQLNALPPRKTFHSLRHYVINVLKRKPGIDKQVLRDVVGHVGEDVHDEVYGESMPVDAKQRVVELLPKIVI